MVRQISTNGFNIKPYIEVFTENKFIPNCPKNRYFKKSNQKAKKYCVYNTQFVSTQYKSIFEKY